MARKHDNSFRAEAAFDPNLIMGDLSSGVHPELEPTAPPREPTLPKALQVRQGLTPEESLLVHVPQLRKAQAAKYHEVASGRPLSQESLYLAMRGILSTGLDIRQAVRPGIVYLEGRTAARQTNFGNIDPRARQTLAKRALPMEMLGQQIGQLRESGVLNDKTSRHHVTAQLKEMVPRFMPSHPGIGWIFLNSVEAKSEDYPGTDQVIDELLAVTGVLDPERQLNLKAQIAKREKRRKQIIHSVVVASLSLNQLKPDAAAAGVTPKGYFRQLVQQNQPQIDSIQYGGIAPVNHSTTPI